MRTHKRLWAVQLAGNVQMARLVTTRTPHAFFNCKIDVTRDLLVKIPGPVIMRAASHVGIDWDGGLTEKQALLIEEFFVARPVWFRYWLESWQDGEHTLQQYGGEVMEIL